jgi:hypothetical protein
MKRQGPILSNEGAEKQHISKHTINNNRRAQLKKYIVSLKNRNVLTHTISVYTNSFYRDFV